MSTKSLLSPTLFNEGDATQRSEHSKKFAALLKDKLAAFKDVPEVQGNPHRDFNDEIPSVKRRLKKLTSENHKAYKKYFAVNNNFLYYGEIKTVYSEHISKSESLIEFKFDIPDIECREYLYSYVFRDSELNEIENYDISIHANNTHTLKNEYREKIIAYTPYDDIS